MVRNLENGVENREQLPLTVKSELEDLNGENPDIDIELGSDGLPRAMAFFDIDKTFTHLQPVYMEAVPQLFPQEVDAVKLWKVYEAGFKLGTSWREFYRMYGIYVLGKKEWIDPEVYTEQFMKPHIGEIDNPGNEYYEIADSYLKKFDMLATAAIQRQYSENPAAFEETKIRPIFHLAKLYKRLKIPMFGMSANPRNFVRQASKVLGLSEYFIDCASDTDVPGAKEYKIDYLIQKAKQKGIPIPYSKLIVVGDSISGDIGSGIRFKKLAESTSGQGHTNSADEISVHGLLVAADQGDVDSARAKIQQDADLAEMAESMNIQAIRTDLVEETTNNGRTSSLMAKGHQNKFLIDLNN
ncbi:MAG: HAD family hydrolase [Patescibacteria group bacterium]